jgi:hypothetical protein
MARVITFLLILLLLGCVSPVGIPPEKIECRPELCMPLVGDDLAADAIRCDNYCRQRGSEIKLMYGLDFHARCKCEDGVDIFMPRSGYEVQLH